MSNNESEEESVCRMCHSEGESDRPLFYPCKCSGSIRYVHQDCLIQWLKVKHKSLTDSKCELCGETYKFRNIYKSGYPSSLSIFEFIMALYPIAISVFLYIYQSLIFITLWVIGLPLITSIIKDLIFQLLIPSSLFDNIHFVSTVTSTATSAETASIMTNSYNQHFFEPATLFSCWTRGIFQILFIGFLSLASFQILYFLYFVSIKYIILNFISFHFI